VRKASKLSWLCTPKTRSVHFATIIHVLFTAIHMPERMQLANAIRGYAAEFGPPLKGRRTWFRCLSALKPVS
jgi:hypothetical protein